MKRGFTCGAFDLCHAGHVLMFKECKQKCDYLIVGLHTNPQTDRPEKNKPIMSLFERYTILNSISYIDKIIVYETEADLLNFLKDLKPDVRFVGADWEGKRFTGDELPIKVIFNSRDHSFSSSELRQRIKKSPCKKTK